MKRIAIAGVALIAFAIAAGCGGGGGVDKSGRASISIQWPEPGRLIPAASNFVRVRARTGESPVGTTPPAVGRPAPGESQTSVITIDNLPVGQDVTFVAEAFAANPDTTPSVAQARGQQTILIRNDAPNTFDISMASTVSRVALFRGATELAQGSTLSLTAGEDANLTAQARDAANALVLVADNNWAWSSANPNLTLNAGTAVTGPAATARGEANINAAAIVVTESESSRTRTLNVQVAAPTYPGFVDTALGDVVNAPDLGAGDKGTKGPDDRVFVMNQPLRGGMQVDVFFADTLQPVPGPPPPPFSVPGQPPANALVRNSSGIAIGRSADFSQFVNANVTNFQDDGAVLWGSDQDLNEMMDLSARRGHTYALMSTATAGFLVNKIRDSDGAIVKQMVAPPGIPFTDRITVDDRENVYFIENNDGADYNIVKMDRNGDRQPFNAPATLFSRLTDLDFDQGLLYLLEADNRKILVLGQSGELVQTIDLAPHMNPFEQALRLTARNGQIFVLTADIPSGPGSRVARANRTRANGGGFRILSPRR